MIDVLTLIQIAFLLTVFKQDLKSRTVSWFLFPVLCLLFLWTGVQEVGWNKMLLNSGKNMLFLTGILALLLLYFIAKRVSPLLVLRKYLGVGDLLMFLVLTMVFSPVNYILFLNLSFILSLIVYLINGFQQGKNHPIPLAGYQAVFLAFVIAGTFFLPDLELRDDTFISQIIFQLI